MFAANVRKVGIGMVFGRIAFSGLQIYVTCEAADRKCKHPR
jgi:hypothetical protein